MVAQNARFHSIVLEKFDRISNKTPSQRDKFNSVNKHILYIETQGWSGSGWLLKNTPFIVSNAHVCGLSGNIIRVTDINKRILETNQYIAHETLDICLIYAGEINTEGLLLSNNNVNQFDEIFIVGYLKGIQILREGYVEGFDGTDLLHHSFTGPGSSGSPVLNSNREVVALHYAAYPKFNMTIGVELESLREGIKKLTEQFYYGKLIIHDQPRN